MASLEDFKERLKNLEAAIQVEFPKIVTTIALSAKALAERRIREQGFGKKYSTKKIPAFFFKGKELNASGRTFLEGLEEGEKTEEELLGLTNWGEFRAAQGLQNDHVDLGYTNKMWASIAPGEVTVVDKVYTCLLGSTNEEGRKKMDWNFARYGDFISAGLNDDDRKILSDIQASEIKRVIDNSTLLT